MKNIKILTVFIFILLVFSAALSSAKFMSGKTSDSAKSIDALEPSPNAKWTVMMYLAYDTHRDRDREITFETFKNAGSNSDFNLVGLYDGLENGDTNYFYVNDEELMVPLSWHESEADMGYADTLKNFIDLTKYLYPADNYALFVCSTHGSGWQGLGCDTHGTGTFVELSLLNMTDYKNVLKDVTANGSDKIDVVGLEICITACVEVAYQISPYVNYMVGTEEHGFGPTDFSTEGNSLEWNFSYFLQNLKDNVDMTPEEFSESIVESYIPGTYIPKIGNKITPPLFYPIINYDTTISAANLTRIDLLSDAVKNLGENLSKHINSAKIEIRKARSQTREYGKLYRKFWFQSSRFNFILQLDPLGYDCFIDLYDFAYNMRQNSAVEEITDACDQVMTALNNTVFANNVLPTDDSYGLFIYFPQYKCQYDQHIWRVAGNTQFRKNPTSYDVLRFSEDTGWNEFVKEYLKI